MAPDHRGENKGNGKDGKTKGRAVGARPEGKRVRLTDKDKKKGAGRPGAGKPPTDRPSERKPGGRPALDERRRKKIRTRIAILSVSGVIVLAAAAICVYYFGFVHPKDNYDAQMKLGMEYYGSGEYAEAEIAFLKALEYKPKDDEATIALADTYTAWEKFDKAVGLLTAMQEADEAETRTYERLITLYVGALNDINAANGQILKAYGLGLALTNEAIAAPPVFTPNGGVYNVVTNVEITAGEGQIIRYTTDGSIPTFESVQYEGPLTLKNRDPLVITAAVIAENGLIGWPSVAEYTINIQYAVESEFLSYIGKPAAEIMGSVGALFYVGEEKGGYYYRNKTGNCFFAFPWEVFQVETPPETDATPATDGAVSLPPDPNRTPLPGDAVCVAVTMKIGQIFVQMGESMPVEDLMLGLNIEDFTVEASATDGLNHLYYSANGYAFDYTLRDAATVAGDGDVTVRAG
ncbi:MAG: chitobiase/beta-hexosaminidase C-terminal domain-containing protein [Clostridiales Family XIII bacterium]|jgi:hypothetical protein|nr:chitobiase/beta-hexosaminidase C-terminal domain-containing protein [Clostridiales Family XIII bacterium]